MRFRKKPVVIEAFQFLGAASVGQPGVFGEDGRHYVVTIHGQRAYLAIGDWVITEPDGRHHYPCKPDIFAATYEPVIEAQKGSGALDEEIYRITSWLAADLSPRGIGFAVVILVPAGDGRSYSKLASNLEATDRAALLRRHAAFELLNIGGDDAADSGAPATAPKSEAP